jgi:hypothetical protein
VNCFPAITSTVSLFRRISLRRPETVIPPIGNAILTASARRSGVSGVISGCARFVIDAHGATNERPKPDVHCNEVGEDAEEFFAETSLIPSFTFVDPFGYKGLSLRIVNGVIKDWGCDCVFFFNYGRINAGLSNPKVKEHMDALFGKTRAEELRKKLEGKTPDQREALILEGLSQAIKEMGGKFVLPFRFKRGARTSHSIIFVSKNFKGYEIMKNIMANESTTVDQEVASFTYSPADASTPLLFSLAQPFDALKKSLPKVFAGKSLTMREIYEKHSVDTPYTDKNYKKALRELETEGQIKADPPASKRRANSFADHVRVCATPARRCSTSGRRSP